MCFSLLLFASVCGLVRVLNDKRCKRSGICCGKGERRTKTLADGPPRTGFPLFDELRKCFRGNFYAPATHLFLNTTWKVSRETKIGTGCDSGGHEGRRDLGTRVACGEEAWRYR